MTLTLTLTLALTLTLTLALALTLALTLTLTLAPALPRRVLPQTTYLVECELTKWLSANLKCEVAGRILELEPDARGKERVVASCLATMANPAQIPGQGYD